MKTAIIEMLSGAEVKVNTATFQNDVEDIKSKDDVLTYMIHLGYLGYNEKKKTAFVPNEEIRQELTTAVEICINYDKRNKKHDCLIESYTKQD